MSKLDLYKAIPLNTCDICLNIMIIHCCHNLGFCCKYEEDIVDIDENTCKDFIIDESLIIEAKL